MTEYFKLPDVLSVSQLRGYFEEYFRVYGEGCEDTVYALDELLELADRRWHTYEQPDIDINERITDYLRSVIDFENEDIMGSVLCIIPRIGLGELFDFILRRCPDIRNVKVAEMIRRCEREYGKTVSDPYAKI